VVQLNAIRVEVSEFFLLMNVSGSDLFADVADGIFLEREFLTSFGSERR
jgi:hypothetical protein